MVGVQGVAVTVRDVAVGVNNCMCGSRTGVAVTVRVVAVHVSNRTCGRRTYSRESPPAVV